VGGDVLQSGCIPLGVLSKKSAIYEASLKLVSHQSGGRGSYERGRMAGRC
jgi:hypothetical protein